MKEMAFLQHNRNKRVLKALFSVIQGPCNITEAGAADPYKTRFVSSGKGSENNPNTYPIKDLHDFF